LDDSPNLNPPTISAEEAFLYAPPESSGREQRTAMIFICPCAPAMLATKRPHWPRAAGSWMGVAEVMVICGAGLPETAAFCWMIMVSFCGSVAV
jgi:hypothetical protein